MLSIDPHPLLDLRAFVTRWPLPLGQLPAPDWLAALGAPDAPAPFTAPDDAHVQAVRALLRHGGFKPAGRSKPCSEYIRGAASKGEFPRINAAVDATNAACLHGGLPVSTVDLDRLTPPLRVGVAEPGTSYVFNRSGQVIDVGGLLCLFDAAGPCANAVKDAQRAKTDEGTTKTLTIVWGALALPGRSEAVAQWHQAVNARLGGEIEGVG